ncbi:MAG: endonuclease NucS domain-containing protein, partial [Candidatus Thorarchaeota archaeon]
FPVNGYIHIKRMGVHYKTVVSDILPHKAAHYENPELAERVKPPLWIYEWESNVNRCQSRPFRSALVLTEIETFDEYYDPYKFKRPDGTHVTRPPQNYVSIVDELPSEPLPQMIPQKTLPTRGTTIPQPQPSEAVLEHFFAQNPQAIEDGLIFIDKQVTTEVGRLDVLCEDSAGDLVVVELKKGRTSDKVVGQISRYIGWVKENLAERGQGVRGLILVGKKDKKLEFAAKAHPRIEVKEVGLVVR